MSSGVSMQPHGSSFLDKAQKLAVLLIPLVGGAFTLVTYYDQQQRTATDKLKQSQELYVKILSERESADAAMRAKIFETLVTRYQEAASRKSREQIPLLEMLILNFHDTLNVAPLMRALSAKLAREHDTEGMAQLQKAAKKMSQQQINLIRNFKWAYDTTRYAYYEVLDLPVRARDSEQWDQSPILAEDKTAPQLSFRVVDVAEDRVTMQFRESGGVEPATFDVSYYDLPLVDNTALNGRKLAFVLDEINKANKMAKVTLLLFPQELTGVRDRPFVEGMMEHLKNMGRGN